MTTPFLIAIDRRVSRPLYEQIYAAFRARILRGELRAGQLVPSTRELARDLRISRLPVLNAYAQLLAEGYFEARTGRGTFVAAAIARRPAASAKHSGDRRVSAHAAGLPRHERPAWAGSLGPFQAGQPDLQSFPLATWSLLVSRHARRMRVKELQYGDPMGLLLLREVIASYVRTSRGVRCDAHQILIVSGSQQALDLSTRVLLDDGDVAWVEDPGYWLVHQVLKASGCHALPVPVDADGLDVDAGTKMAQKARASFVAPSHQYPLGVTMTVARRLQLLAWAQRNDAWVIEDDYDSEYRYDSMPIASLQGLDRSSRVIYIDTFSKVMFPSLRLGYVIVPEDLVERFAAMRQAMDLGPPPMTQAVMAEFMREGHFSRHIRRMRPVYADRRRVLMREIERQLGAAVKIMGGEAGMHIALMFDARIDDRGIAAAAAKESLWLSALSDLYLGPDRSYGFVLGFGNTKATQIPGAVRRLAQLVQESR